MHGGDKERKKEMKQVGRERGATERKKNQNKRSFCHNLVVPWLSENSMFYLLVFCKTIARCCCCCCYCYRCFYSRFTHMNVVGCLHDLKYKFQFCRAVELYSCVCVLCYCWPLEIDSVWHNFNSDEDHGV